MCLLVNCVSVLSSSELFTGIDDKLDFSLIELAVERDKRSVSKSRSKGG